ncbi:MAG: ATP-dependent metallopeptidase FtsH/Yme1/Tma family protein, partial [Salinisphaera sp.]|nr:ATP-dependent metallopeptidase FtsH/Yme1/Tma family protein [Salinisphaera sp.]
MNDLAKNLLLWVVIALVLMSVFSSFAPSGSSAQKIPYSQFLEQVKAGRVAQVQMQGHNISGMMEGGGQFQTYSPESDNKAMIGTLLEHQVKIVGEPPDRGSLLQQILISWFPFLLLIGVWIYCMRQMQGGGGGRGAMSFGRSKARMMAADQIKITFEDVAGVEEAKSEVQELVEFLSDPGKFQRVGGKIPRG